MDLSFLLPDGLAPVVFAGLVAASAVTSAITASFGIGGGVIMLALMASTLPASALIAVHGAVQLSSNAGRFWMLRDAVAPRALGVFAIGAAAGCLLGGLVAVELPGWAVQAGVGLFVLWAVLARVPVWIGRWPLVAGLVSSVLTMFFGATGPFVAVHVRALGLPRQGQVGTNAAMMTIQHALKLVVFGALGFAFGPWLGLIALMSLSGLAGTWIGTHVLGRMSEAGFRRALDILLILIALRLLWQGLSGAAAG